MHLDWNKYIWLMRRNVPSWPVCSPVALVSKQHMFYSDKYILGFGKYVLWWGQIHLIRISRPVTSVLPWAALLSFKPAIFSLNKYILGFWKIQLVIGTNTEEASPADHWWPVCRVGRPCCHSSQPSATAGYASVCFFHLSDSGYVLKYILVFRKIHLMSHCVFSTAKRCL